MRVDDFDYHLPEERIALRPASPRDSSRLLHLGAALGDYGVRDLPQLLNPGDCLVVNDTRVIPAELTGERIRGENITKVHVTLHKRLDASRWLAFARPARRFVAGDRLRFGSAGETCAVDALWGTVESRNEAEVVIAFDDAGPDLDRAIAMAGAMPLPHYIGAKRGVAATDAGDYQTVYARHDGAVAAPTAGLHFTPDLLAALAARGITTRYVTLHVGAGTFLPVKSDDTADHTMHSEWCEVTQETADALNATRAQGGRIVAVGTTALRTLETATGTDGIVRPFMGDTSIFILPGYRFRAVDVLMTNFHLPRSTLLMLVSAFAGTARVQAAYAHAIAQGYRFYSYGDACLMERAE